jgi:CRP-like cAMP-binding protein
MAAQGTPLAGMRCIRSGLTRCWQVDDRGKEYTTSVAWPCSVSLVGLRGRGARWPWNVTSVVPTTVLTFPWDVLERVRRRCPIDQAIMESAGEDYIRRHIWSGMLRSLKLRPRLRILLRRLADELGTETAEGVTLDHWPTQQDLASLTFVTRYEVGRVLREFTETGLIRPIGRRSLLIPDLDRIHPPIELSP